MIKAAPNRGGLFAYAVENASQIETHFDGSFFDTNFNIIQGGNPMKKLLTLFLALTLILVILPTASFAADTPDDALGEVDIFNGDHEIAYLSINGSVRTQKYTYYNFTQPDGTVRETPAYCVNPNLYGVPQTVGPGESIKYIANEKASDPKVVGIICNGYPHYSL